MKTNPAKQKQTPTPKAKGKSGGKNGASVQTPAVEVESSQNGKASYSPLKLILIEKSIADGQEYAAKKLSDDALVSYPTVLDLVHNVKKRYGIRTLKAIADTLTIALKRPVALEEITPK